MGNRAYLGLGSNKGNRLAYLLDAVNQLSLDDKIKVISVSSVYETKPFGNVEQSNYYNAAILINTDYNPLKFYYRIKEIEKIVGRTVSERWGAREIDIDILLFNNLVYKDETIEIPHKELLQRDFVLIPLITANCNKSSPTLSSPEKLLIAIVYIFYFSFNLFKASNVADHQSGACKDQTNIPLKKV